MKWLKPLSIKSQLKKYAHEVSCPVCLEQFYMADAPFRCQTTACSKEPDNVIADMFALDAAPKLGRVFQSPYAQSWLKTIRRHTPETTCPCPSCKIPASLRLCPNCHAPLPTDFWAHPTYVIALAGPEKSGKTGYLEGMLNRISMIGGDSYNISLKPATEVQSPWHPALYRYVNNIDGSTKGFVLFFEIPSASLQAYEKLHGYQDLLKRIDGLFVFLDPATFPGIGGAKKRDTEKAIDTLTNYLSQLQLRKERAALPPTAFVLTKLDLVMNLLPQNTLLRHDTTPTANQAENDSYQISREVRGYLASWAGPGILQTIQHTYLRTPHRFFGVSSDAGKEMPQSYAPLRLEEPFLWLLRTLCGPLSQASLPTHSSHVTLSIPTNEQGNTHEAIGRGHSRTHAASTKRKNRRAS